MLAKLLYLYIYYRKKKVHKFEFILYSLIALQAIHFRVERGPYIRIRTVPSGIDNLQTYTYD